MDNANQVGATEDCHGHFLRTINSHELIETLYKQLNPFLQLSPEQFSNAVNALPFMSEHVIVGPDPSVNSDLVRIIKEEFEKGTILFATDVPIANANGAHIDAFVMDSYTVSSNTYIATSANEMITNLPWEQKNTL